MPLPITTVFLIAALCCAILGVSIGVALGIAFAALIEIGLFVAGGFGGLGS